MQTANAAETNVRDQLAMATSCSTLVPSRR